MDLRDLVGALLRHETIAARQWVADAYRAGFRWEDCKRPEGLDPIGLAVAAGIVEMMSGRSQSQALAWTAAVPAAPERTYLVEAAKHLPRLRRLCEEEGPEPLRRRGLVAPPEFLTAA